MITAILQPIRGHSVYLYFQIKCRFSYKCNSYIYNIKNVVVFSNLNFTIEYTAYLLNMNKSGNFVIIITDIYSEVSRKP